MVHNYKGFKMERIDDPSAFCPYWIGWSSTVTRITARTMKEMKAKIDKLVDEA